MMTQKILPFIEISSLLIFLVLLVGFFSQKEDTLVPLTAQALEASSSKERWNGIFFQDQHVGYSVARTSELAGGGLLMEQRSVFQVVTFGKLQKIVTAGAALSGQNGLLQRFDFLMMSEDIKISAQGEIKGKQINMEIRNGESVSNLSFDVERPPHVSLSLEAAIRQQELKMGQTFSIPYFDPVSLTQQDMAFRVTGTEILENGEEAWWVQSSFAGVVTRSLVDARGDLLRQEGGGLGLSVVRMDPQAAQNLPSNQEPVDLIALSAVRLKGNLKKARSRTKLVLDVSGVDANMLMHDPPVQVIQGTQIAIAIPQPSSFEDEPVATTQEDAFLEETITIPVSHPEIRQKVAELLSNVTTRKSAVQTLNDFVFTHLKKEAVIGVPNGLEALRMAKGDCNEHAALFVSLARSAGIPTKLVAGLVYSERSGPVKSFYYHAWAEVLIQDQWIPVDPTFGQFPADATHIKVAEGDLDKQISIMGLLGKISLTLIDAQ